MHCGDVGEAPPRRMIGTDRSTYPIQAWIAISTIEVVDQPNGQRCLRVKVRFRLLGNETRLRLGNGSLITIGAALGRVLVFEAPDIEVDSQGSIGICQLGHLRSDLSVSVRERTISTFHPLYFMHIPGRSHAYPTVLGPWTCGICECSGCARRYRATSPIDSRQTP